MNISSVDVFLAALAKCGFQGDADTSIPGRQLSATDNSIYEVQPQVVVYPQAASDISLVVKAANQAGMDLTARGAGTGTNGQALNYGAIIDTSRFLRHIKTLDLAQETVTVEPGVTIAELNQFLAPHGRYFPIVISTSSRATVGGMIATNACGKGSRICGRMADHLVSLDLVLSDGTEHTAKAMSENDAEVLSRENSLLGSIYDCLLSIRKRHQPAGLTTITKMPREVGGYSLRSLIADTQISMLPIVAGSEGTLAITKTATLNIAKRPAHKALIVVTYSDFTSALEHVSELLTGNPAAIETLDDRILTAAQQDIIWNRIESTFAGPELFEVKGMNFVEVVSDDALCLEEAIRTYRKLLASVESQRWRIVSDPALIADLWKLREIAVGLLAKNNQAQGIPFIEDTAVQPLDLPAYSRKLRQILDGHGLSYGMFGHADVGCLHVRPILNMREPGSAALVRSISDQVAQLVLSFRGNFWGEHGKGFRGEYSRQFFGDDLYQDLIAIKQAFDPQARLNGGKLVDAYPHQPIRRLDGVTFRGTLDRDMPPQAMRDYGPAVACNGNGACLGSARSEAMCPSYKATGDRAQSPQGRAILLRHWARVFANGTQQDVSVAEAAVKQALSSCLSCKACATQCPVSVDIAAMKSRFMEAYYRHRRRPLRHWLLAELEQITVLGRAAPRLFNALTSLKLTKWGLSKLFGIVDLPKFKPARKARKIPASSVPSLGCVLLMEDTFTSTFDGNAVDGCAGLLECLGYTVERSRPRPNGKALYVLGLRNAFQAIAEDRNRLIASIYPEPLAVVGVDAATSLLYENEYREFAPASKTRIVGLEHFLSREIASGRLKRRTLPTSQAATLFQHCTESAFRPMAADEWSQVFAHFGIALTVPGNGCCGMAGSFGHEMENAVLSRKIFAHSWAPYLPQAGAPVVATGFSCRCQVRRFADRTAVHPAQYLLTQLTQARN
jgi:FAD/FMN-containing dehydrogenase/Fe-S oxidoreductase